MTKVEPPNNFANFRRKIEKERARAEVKKMPITDDDCFVCGEDISEVLRRHHLVLVAEYCHRPDINNHLMTLCECCHDLAHKLVYNERGGVSWRTVEKLKERGMWERFVEIDRMAYKALLGIPYREEQCQAR